jgi:adenylate kinase
VGARLEAYHAQTAPLIAYYDEKGQLSRVDAMGDIDAITAKMTEMVESAIS